MLFLPVPKAGCTSVLWRLAELAGLPPRTFERSGAARGLRRADRARHEPVAPRAPASRTYEGDERERILAEDGWLRFTLVRDPGAAPVVGLAVQAAAARAALRRRVRRGAVVPARARAAAATSSRTSARFVAARRARARPRTSTGRSSTSSSPSSRSTTSAASSGSARRSRCCARTSAPSGWPAPAGRENRARSPLPPRRLRRARPRRCCATRYARRLRGLRLRADRARRAADRRTWERARRAAAPARCARRSTSTRGSGSCTASRSARGRRAQAAEERLEARARARSAHARAPTLTQPRGRRPTSTSAGRWADGAARARASPAVVRVQGRGAHAALGAAAAAARGRAASCWSTTARPTAPPRSPREVAGAAGAADRLEVHDYPFAVARCGDEHLGTPADSVHSLAYFYNWSFAHVRTGYALKWDGDMVLTDAAAGALRDLAWQLEAAEAVVRVPRLPALRRRRPARVPRHRAAQLRAVGVAEPAGLQLRQGARLGAAAVGRRRRDVTLPDWACVELKHLDADEFAPLVAHRLRSLGADAPQAREWAVFTALAGGGAPPAGVVAIVAPAGRARHRPRARDVAAGAGPRRARRGAARAQRGALTAGRGSRGAATGAACARSSIAASPRARARSVTSWPAASQSMPPSASGQPERQRAERQVPALVRTAARRPRAPRATAARRAARRAGRRALNIAAPRPRPGRRAPARRCGVAAAARRRAPGRARRRAARASPPAAAARASRAQTSCAHGRAARPRRSPPAGRTAPSPAVQVERADQLRRAEREARRGGGAAGPRAWPRRDPSPPSGRADRSAGVEPRLEPRPRAVARPGRGRARRRGRQPQRRPAAAARRAAGPARSAMIVVPLRRRVAAPSAVDRRRGRASRSAVAVGRTRVERGGEREVLVAAAEPEGERGSPPAVAAVRVVAVVAAARAHGRDRRRARFWNRSTSSSSSSRPRRTSRHLSRSIAGSGAKIRADAPSSSALTRVMNIARYASSASSSRSRCSRRSSATRLPAYQCESVPAPCDARSARVTALDRAQPVVAGRRCSSRRWVIDGAPSSRSRQLVDRRGEHVDARARRGARGA